MVANGMTDDAFLRRMEIELVYPVRLKKLKRLYGDRVELLLKATDRFTGPQPGRQDFQTHVSSKKYADIAKLMDFYGMLGVAQDANDEQIEAGYKARGSNPHSKEAFEVLSDPDNRVRYDDKLGELSDLFVEQVKLPSFRMLGLGGCGEIGRSAYYVRVGNHFVLLDAGIKIIQGQNEPSYPRLDVLEMLPPIEAVFVSHVHADHVGALHRAPADVPIYMTPKSLEDLEFLSKGFVQQETWSSEERDIVLSRCVPVDSGELNGLKFRLVNAGHVPGSAMVLLQADGDSLLYTGDINLEETKFEAPAQVVGEKINALIIEGTYAKTKEERAKTGKRETRSQREKELIDTINEAIVARKRILIPAFAIGRTSEVIKIIDDAIESGDIPKVKAFSVGQGAYLTATLGRPKHFELIGVSGGDEDREPRRMDMVKVTYNLKRLMASDGSAIVVAGSGFADQSQAAQLVSSVVHNEGVLVLGTGYVAPGSTLDLLIRAKKGEPVRLSGTHGGTLHVECDVKVVGLSAHASEEMLLKFIQEQDPEVVFFVHTYKAKGRGLAELVKRRNITPANLQVAFSYGHRGLRLFPYNSEESASTFLCSCKMTFADKSTAIRHAGMEGHKLILDISWYRFSVSSQKPLQPKDIKGSFYGRLDDLKTVLTEYDEKQFLSNVSSAGGDPVIQREYKIVDAVKRSLGERVLNDKALAQEFLQSITVKDLYVIGNNVVVEGRLRPEVVKYLELAMDQVGRTLVNTRFLKEEVLPVVPTNFPLLVDAVASKIEGLVGKQIERPAYRVRRLPPGMAGVYYMKRRLLVVNRNVGDEEDLNLVMTHEIGHHAHYDLNHRLKNLDLRAPGAVERYHLFVEGFAQYIAVKLGCSRKLIADQHEKGPQIPRWYAQGREMFEDIDTLHGTREAVNLGINGVPDDLVRAHASMNLEKDAGKSVLVTEVMRQLKEKKVWRRYRLFFKGIPPKIMNHMIGWSLSNYAKVYAEFAGWNPEDVYEDVMSLCLSDYLISQHGLTVPRNDLKNGFRIVMRVKYPDQYKRIMNLARAADVSSIVSVPLLLREEDENVQ